MIRRVSIVWLVSALFLAAGCVQRTISIRSEPPGALVYLNDEEVGRTPVKVPFTFYGTYDVRLELDGYQTLHTAQEARGPWWEAPGPDLMAEVLPGTRRVNLEWSYALAPAEELDEQALLERAREMQRRATGGSP